MAKYRDDINIENTIYELSQSRRGKIAGYIVRSMINVGPLAISDKLMVVHLVKTQCQHLDNLVEMAKKLGYTDENFLNTIGDKGQAVKFLEENK